MNLDNKIVIYQTEDGQTQIDVRMENETVWLTQAQMAELFQTDRTSIVRHINNIYKVEELERDATCAKIAQVQKEGERTVRRLVPYFNLDMIISVGYRVNSKRGVKFRQWAIHRAIFDGVFKHAGRFRDYDISKKEWVFEGDSVLYGRWQDLRMAIEYDLDQERQFDYTVLTKKQMVEHLANFISGLWQIHPFAEGNTRTIAIFTIKYLRSQGFQMNNELFELNSWYFRNALVRANYRNLEKGINYDSEYLNRFFANLLLGDKWI